MEMTPLHQRPIQDLTPKQRAFLHKLLVLYHHLGVTELEYVQTNDVPGQTLFGSDALYTIHEYCTGNEGSCHRERQEVT